MTQRTIRRAGGLMACALAIALVVGPAASAFADGGPDRVAPTQQASGGRPGFGDRLHPSRPGFGDRLDPKTSPVPAPAAPVSATVATGNGGGFGTTTMVVFAGMVVLAGAAVLTTVRRRHRPAHA